ncbi:MAG: hypothetical protein ACOY82_06950 [Pseudomonadota bacterium]
MKILLLVAIGLGALVGPIATNAGCGDRPGTPDQPHVQTYPNGHVYFSWRATHGRSEPELIMFYDVYVWDQATGTQTRALTGVPPAFAALGPEVPGGVSVVGFPRYGERAGAYFTDLPLNVRQCFSVRTRTEPGTEGCISELASAPVCAMPVKRHRLGRRR